MLKMDKQNKTLQTLQKTSLMDESILERYGLQKSIVSSWSAFCSELDIGPLWFLGEEIIPHSSCRDSIDILALDRDGTPVIVELKRDKNKLQLLQALSYAAMVSTWSIDNFVDKFCCRLGLEDARIVLSSLEKLPSPRIVLVAESYDPEVILTADFLSKRDVRIDAIKVNLAQHNEDLFLSFERKFPLAGLDDMYVPRVQKREMVNDIQEDISWNDVIRTTTIPWAAALVDALNGKANGRPDRRYFGTFNTKLGKVYGAHVRSNNIAVYFYDQSQESKDRLEKTFDMAVEPWGKEDDRRSGWTLRLKTEEELQKFLRHSL